MVGPTTTNFDFSVHGFYICGVAERENRVLVCINSRMMGIKLYANFYVHGIYVCSVAERKTRYFRLEYNLRNY